MNHRKPSDSDVELVGRILEWCAEPADVERLGRRALDDDLVARRAAERLVEIIGDATGRLSLEFRERNPELPYAEAKALRNVLAHQYQRLDLDLLWSAIEVSIPELARSLVSLTDV